MITRIAARWRRPKRFKCFGRLDVLDTPFAKVCLESNLLVATDVFFYFSQISLEGFKACFQRYVLTSFKSSGSEIDSRKRENILMKEENIRRPQEKMLLTEPHRPRSFVFFVFFCDSIKYPASFLTAVQVVAAVSRYRA